MQRIIAVIFLVGTLSCVNADASAADSRDFLDTVRATLGSDLPDISSVVTGYARPSERSPSLLVADFTSNESGGLDWGRTVGQLLRWDLMYSPGVRLRMPDYRSHYVDGTAGVSVPNAQVGRSLPSLRLIGERLGIDRALTGHLDISGDRFDLKVALRELPGGTVVRKFRAEGSTGQLHATLLAVSRIVMEALDIELDDRFERRASAAYPLSYNQLQLIAQAFTDPDDGEYRRNQRHTIRALWAQGMRTPVVAALYLYFMDVGQDVFGHERRLTDVQARLPYDAGIELSVARYLVTDGAPDLVSKKVGILKRLVRENPNDPTTMIVLCDTLVDTGETARAVASCVEALERWPDNYRVWWSMGWSLLKHAWSIRGNSYWRDVSPEAKRLFPKLKELADRAVNQALALNRDNANLWILKLETIGRYSSELMDAFFRATELDPTARGAYQNALNYSQPQWGGSYSAQKRILDEAEKNGLDPAVITELRARYVREPSLMDRIESVVSKDMIWVIVVVVVVVIVYRLRKSADKSAPKGRTMR